MHAAHILLRKLFVVPILLAAIWFGMRGAVLAATSVSLVYLPYTLVAWSGRPAENMNQGGEVVTFWIVGLLAGWLATRERRALQRAADMSRDALKALVAALDAREHQTEQHSHRDADLAHRIGRQLRLDSWSLTVLREAAVLHDVGKIGVPDHVLLKPGPLTDEERRIMQRHAEMGHEILIAATHLREVAELVYAHHERFDGTGYPRGLAGEAIPFGARIFAVADVYDALTNDRPYRNAMSHSEAVQLVCGQSGCAFDPAVVSAFAEEMRERHTLPSQSLAQGVAAP
jgi:HD-GYP domain-containing protein (c-di-GMP phosphodiesterase class II)